MSKVLTQEGLNKLITLVVAKVKAADAKAEDAKTAAETADGKAETAKSKAEDADGKATQLSLIHISEPTSLRLLKWKLNCLQNLQILKSKELSTVYLEVNILPKGIKKRNSKGSSFIFYDKLGTRYCFSDSYFINMGECDIRVYFQKLDSLFDTIINFIGH